MEIVIGVFLDLKKHSMPLITNLFKKSYHYGIRRNLFNFIESYLTNKAQFVLCNRKNQTYGM